MRTFHVVILLAALVSCGTSDETDSVPSESNSSPAETDSGPTLWDAITATPADIPGILEATQSENDEPQEETSFGEFLQQLFVYGCCGIPILVVLFFVIISTSFSQKPGQDLGLPKGIEPELNELDETLDDLKDAFNKISDTPKKPSKKNKK